MAGLFDTVQDTPTTGLLGQGFNDPRSAAIMALAGSMVRGDFGGGLLGANDAFQKTLNANIDRQAKQQEIGLNTLKLLQAKRMFDLQQAALSGADGQQTQAAPNPAAPQIALAQGSDLQPPLNLPDGSRLNTGGVGPTNANAQRLSAVPPMQAPVPSDNPYVSAANSLGMTPRSATMQAIMFPDAFNKALGAAMTPTDATKLALAGGLDPRATNAAYARKGSWVAPTNVRGFGLVGPDGLMPLPMNAPQGSMPQQDPNTGAWSFVPVAGGAQAVQAASQATQTGKTLGTLNQGVGADGKPTYFFGAPPGALGAPTAAPSTPTPQPQGQGDPNAASTPYQRAGSDVAAIQREIARVNGSLAPLKTKQMQLGILNQELAKASAATGAQPDATPVIRPGLSVTDQALTDQGGKYYQAATADASNVGTLRQMLEEINTLAADPKVKFGPGAPEMAHVLALAKNVGIDMTGAQTAQDLIGKLASNIVMSQLGQGATGTDAQMNQLIHANPNGEMTNQAILQVVPLLKQQLDVRQARANVINNAVGQSQNFAKVPPVLNQFNKLASPPVVSLGVQLAEAQKSGNGAAFIRGLTPQQRILLPQVKQLDQLGAF